MQFFEEYYEVAEDRGYTKMVLPLVVLILGKVFYQGGSLSLLPFVLCFFPLTVLLQYLNKGFNVDGI